MFWVLVVLNPKKTPPEFFFRRPELGGKKKVSKIFSGKKTAPPNPVAPNPTKPLRQHPNPVEIARWSVGCEVEAMLPEEMMPEGLGVKWASGEWVNF